MNEMTESQNVTIEKVAEILESAAIDHEVTDDGQLYVTGHPFNFWLRVDEKRHLLVWWTYWEFTQDVDELEALRFCNFLCHNKIMVQFSKSTENDRLYGHFMLPIRDGLNPKLLLRISQKFSAIFHESVQMGINDNLLVPFNCSDDMCPAAPTTTH